MKNLDLLFSENCYNYGKIHKGRESYLVCRIKSMNDLWTGYDIRRMIGFTNEVIHRYNKVKIPLHFVLDGETFIDKLTYVFLECICYYLICKGYPVQIFMNVKCEIGIEGIGSSPLLLLNDTKLKSVRLFPEKFKKDIYGNHFRRIITSYDMSTNIIGNIYTEIDTFLKIFEVTDDFRDKVALTIAELAGNAIEHAETDCLLDIDVTTAYEKKGDEKRRQYYGVNIAVVNFSKKLLGDDLNNKLLNSNDKNIQKRYAKVLEAYNYHSQYFDTEYLVEDFFNITSFQHKISGRKNVDGETGGTGLTLLIKSLQELSEAYRCYVISGNRCINFQHKFLEYDKDNWIGFNEDNNFFTAVPNKELVTECLIYMPGTAYNLNFVMKGDNS